MDLEKIINSIDQEPYYREKEGVLYCADCMDILPQIPEKSIDLVLTDPPYGINKEGIINDESLEIYYATLRELYYLLRDDTWFITYCSISNLPYMFNSNLFEYVWQIIEYEPMKRNRNIPIGFSNYKSILVFKKRTPKLYLKNRDIIVNKKDKNIMEVFNKSYHLTTKNTRVIIDILMRFSKIDDLVLDPFLGSGTTAVASKKLGRQWIGIEISQKYCDIAVRRLKKVQFGCSLKNEKLKQKTLEEL